jgi:hypothetical protein
MVLDYTRLFKDRIPSFAEDANGSPEQAASQRRLFEYYFRLGRTPAEVEDQLRAELSDLENPGFYSHFLFSFRDVWPPSTDWRDLHRDEALARLPGIIAAYSEYSREARAEGMPPALLITNEPPADPHDGRVNELIASTADPDATVQPTIYLQEFPQDGAIPRHRG